MALGGVLSVCNIYSGLKIGFTANMSIAAALMGFGVWHLAGRLTNSRPFGVHENTINQTAASAAASIAGAGLVAPIPALTMLTGRALSWPWLTAWALSVSLVGVVVGVGLRRRLIVSEGLPFPYGIATATMLREMYDRGKEALERVRVLIGAAAIAGGVKVLVNLLRVPLGALPGRLTLGGAAGSVGSASMTNLTFGFDPSLLMVGIGGLIGMRAGASMLLGAVVGWGVLTPWVIEQGWIPLGELLPGSQWFKPVTGWMLWPGVALMVSAALTSFGWSLPGIIRGAIRGRQAGAQPETATPDRVPRRWFLAALAATLVASVTLQLALFDIKLYAAVGAVLLTFALALVAGRVAGETGIAPIGAMGQVTQLTFAGIAPGNVTANLMAANVAGGAASQCSDMLHDLKTGWLLGAWARHQAVAQSLGVLAGAVCGSAIYLVLVPDPSAMLITEAWPAPAVAQWKAVAEVFSQGMDALPAGAVSAALIAAAVGSALTVAEKLLPAGATRWIPSSASVGLAFVLPAYYSISVFIGAGATVIAHRLAPRSLGRFTIVAAAGLIAGESLVGVILAVLPMLT